MFPCNKCGACCRNLNRSPLYDEMHNGDGICRYLKGNLCSIYQDRPLICRIDDAYRAFFKKEMTLEEYYERNKKACEMLNNQK